MQIEEDIVFQASQDVHELLNKTFKENPQTINVYL
jgi:hypothetical protein